MGITIGWQDDAKRVMRYHLDKNWTWEEFFAAKKQANTMMDSVSHKFGVIVDVSKEAKFRPNILPNVRKALTSTHPNAFFVVIVAPRAYTYTMLRQAIDTLRFSAVRLEIVPNLDQANTIMTQRLQANCNDDTINPPH